MRDLTNAEIGYVYGAGGNCGGSKSQHKSSKSKHKSSKSKHKSSKSRSRSRCW